MLIPNWPDSLPQGPQLSDYSETHSSLAQSVTTGNKAILLRRNSTRAQDKLSVSFMLKRKQVEYFTKFFYDTLSGGTLRFNFTHPRTLASIEVSFDPTSDEGFSVTPQETMDLYKVAFTLIVWD